MNDNHDGENTTAFSLKEPVKAGITKKGLNSYDVFICIVDAVEGFWSCGKENVSN